MSGFQPNKVLEHLYISGILGVTEQNIKSRNISLIIDLTVENEPISIDDVEIFKLEIEDDPSVMIKDHFDTCSDKIKMAASLGRSVLVHCMAGVSRSATICIAYLMKHNSMTLLQAYNHLKSIRPHIRPNPGFFEQLIEYEKMLSNGISTVAMVTSSIGRVPDVYKLEQDSSLDDLASQTSIWSRDSVGSGNEADDEASKSNVAIDDSDHKII